MPTGLVGGRVVARGRAALVLVAAALLVAAVVAPGALGSSTLNWGAGVAATLPGDASGTSDVEIHVVSCASTGNCSAIGRYTDTSDNVQGLLMTQTNGIWTSVKAPLPAGANSDPVPALNGLSCASAGNCSAVGTYKDGTDATQLVVLGETSGTWSVGSQPSLPASSTNPNLSSVSCTSAGNCTAVGWYTDSSSNQQGVILTETAGTWTSAEAPLPQTPTGNPVVYLVSVSCSSTGNCAAVGDYNDNSNHAQGLLLTETAGTWTAENAPLPTAAYPNPGVYLQSVSCAPTGECAAGGSYQDSSNFDQALLLNESSGAWTPTKATMPAGAGANPQAYVEAVSCPSVGVCSAVGYYQDSSPAYQGMVLTESGGVWGAAAKAVLPAGAGTNPSVQFSSLSCPSAGNCAAVGGYTDNSSAEQGVLVSESAGHWAPGVKATLPANASANPMVILDAVSCTSVTSCTAGGRYNSATAQPGVILTSGKASPTMSVAAPAGLTAGQTIAGSSVIGALASGAAPVGAIQFRVFGPQASPPSSCLSGGHLVGGPVTVSGNRAYHPAAAFTPTAAGTYWWYAAYGGDLSDNPAGSACGASMARTAVVPVPTVNGFKQAHARWREGSALARITATRRAPVGTVFKFRLNEAATVKLVFTHGTKVKGRLSLPAKAGARKLRFQGRLSRKHRLAPGRYTVRITATNPDHVTSSAKKLRFTIVK